MPDIVIATLNAKYIHASFGLRYLMANLGPLQSRACIREFDLNQRPVDIAEVLLGLKPQLIGFGVYIWNSSETTELIALLKRLAPHIRIVVGGPEVSFETQDQPICGLADHVITGEADLKFAEVAGAILQGRPPAQKVIVSELPDLGRMELPYEFYTEGDIAHRIVYVEASRGCPFTCEFCLSSLEVPVRQVPLMPFLASIDRLLDRGVRQFKFVDRTFNLNLATSRAILQFCLEKYRPGLFFHFELVPDRLPECLREAIARFPPGALQFEVGVQTFNPEVATLISRRQNYQKLEENLRFLRNATGVHVHADLIAGLPGESLDSFSSGFDRLVALRPQEIQVGILKRLRGTPIVRHDAQWQMIYNPCPPYELLRNRLLDFDAMQRIRRFARFWDLVYNSGNFLETAPMIWAHAPAGAPAPSPFLEFSRFSDWLHQKLGRTDGIALVRLMQLVFDYLTLECRVEPPTVARTLWRDYRRGGRKDKPSFLKDFVSDEDARLLPKFDLPKRQARHIARPPTSEPVG